MKDIKHNYFVRLRLNKKAQIEKNEQQKQSCSKCQQSLRFQIRKNKTIF